jgi:ribosomal protein L11
MNLVEKYYTTTGAHNVKFIIEPNKAAPGSSMATLSQKQVQMKAFCDFFNKASLEFIENKKKTINDFPLFSIINTDQWAKSKLFVKMRIYDPKNWEVKIKNTSVANLIKMAIKLEKGCATPGKSVIGEVKKSVLVEIAKFKMSDMNARVLEKAINTVIGTAKSMGLKIENDC